MTLPLGKLIVLAAIMFVMIYVGNECLNMFYDWSDLVTARSN